MPTLTTEMLQHKAGAKSFWRGLGYRDSVIELRVLRRHVAARVEGAGSYAVELAWRDEQLAGECSCPYGEQGFFCKHLVAVGLVLLDRGHEVPPADAEDVELRSHLRTLSHEELVELLYHQAGRDRSLYDLIHGSGEPAEPAHGVEERGHVR
ncbi:SWIM zinc finger domain-containing protein [Umezawaea endophytica]|uniref:SWIM zinc finger family protein n=1 Tax=Umezawaea endophytica TaxID=1654476 RepID=A0A9X3AGI3_9PSEU|nr:SWIM zinc finger family protein [Umezawaea endophytica]MCS7480152.1 SWIM zinc finger family protein [Umezawaea endophytica]